VRACPVLNTHRPQFSRLLNCLVLSFALLGYRHIVTDSLREMPNISIQRGSLPVCQPDEGDKAAGPRNYQGQQRQHSIIFRLTGIT